MNNSNDKSLTHILFVHSRKGRETLFPVYLSKTLQFLQFSLNLINTLEACWIGTGPYDITEGQVRVNQGVKDCLQYSRGYKHYLIRS